MAKSLKLGILVMIILIVVTALAAVTNAVTTNTATTRTTCVAGVCNMVASFDDINYWNGSEYLPIITNITNSSYLTYDYELVTAPYQAYFQDNINTGDAVRFEKNGYSFVYDLSGGKMQWVEQVGNPTKVKSIGAIQTSNPSIIGDEIIYHNAFSLTNITYKLKNTLLKEDFILSEHPPDEALYLYLEYTGEVGFDANLTIYANGQDQTNKSFQTSGKVELKDPNNNTIYYLIEPYAVDANGTIGAAYYNIKPGTTKLAFGLRVNKTFLDNAEYPVTIDPSITINTTGTNTDDGSCKAGTWDYTGTNAVGEFSGDYDAGVRFIGINIPQGAQILNANISVEPSTQNTDSSLELAVSAHDIDNTTTFPTSDASCTAFLARARTGNWTQWSDPSWIANNKVASPNISSSIEEVISRPGWVANNSLMIFLDNNGTTASLAKFFYGDSANNGALLSISYNPDATDPVWTQEPANFSWDNGTLLTMQYNATDGSGISTYYINESTFFTMNSSGYMTNNTAVSAGNYSIIVSVNDTYNNTISTTITLEAYYNVPPAMSAYNTTPDSPYVTDALKFNITCQDNNAGASLTGYVQMYNGTTTYNTTQSASVVDSTNKNIYNLTAGVARKGETWTGEYWCSDGSSNTTKQNESVTVLNSIPTFTSAAITPDPAYKSSNLTCAVSGASDSDGDSTTSYFRFLDTDNTTVLQAWGTTAVYDCYADASCLKADLILCEAKIDDAAVNSTVKNDTQLISNAAPEARSVYIYPTNPAVSYDLECRYTYYDVDDDSEVAQEYKWYLNNSLTTNTTANLSSAYLVAGDNWTCEVKVDDGENNATPVNATTVQISVSNPTIASFSYGGEVNAGSNITFTWVWDDPQIPPAGGQYTHYVCNSTNMNSSGCIDTEYCSVEDNTSTSSCQFTTSASTPHNNTAYVMTVDGSNLTSNNISLNFTVNHRPVFTTVAMNVTATTTANTYICNLSNRSDEDNDTLSNLYTFYDYTGNVLQATSTNATYVATSGEATHGNPVTCQAEVNDSAWTSADVNTSTHFRITSLSYDSSRVQNVLMNIYFNTTNTTNVTEANLTLINPLTTTLPNLAVSFSGTYDLWTYNFAPNIVGTWTVSKIRAVQDNGESYLFIGSSDTFTVSAPALGGGGGGGRSVTIQEFTTSNQTLAAFCGDNICQASENPATCWQDCKVNYDTLFTCVWDDEIECNWSQTWFPAALLIMLVLVGAVAIYKYEINTKRRT